MVGPAEAKEVAVAGVGTAEAGVAEAQVVGKVVEEAEVGRAVVETVVVGRAEAGTAVAGVVAQAEAEAEAQAEARPIRDRCPVLRRSTDRRVAQLPPMWPPRCSRARQEMPVRPRPLPARQREQRWPQRTSKAGATGGSRLW